MNHLLNLLAGISLACGICARAAELPANRKEPAMQLPPEVTRYLKGAPPEGRQFDFLIGHWDVAATRYGSDGSIVLEYRASWNARHLNDGRMVMDDFKSRAPDGREISSYVTLRTYCETTGRWEMAGLAALQPAANAQWNGQFKDGEMQLEAKGANPEGKTVLTRIRFFDISQERFSWESRVSVDGGATWMRQASLIATRTK
jgi:hypothetical protein